jgi:hypothetical protein
MMAAMSPALASSFGSRYRIAGQISCSLVGHLVFQVRFIKKNLSCQTLESTMAS